MEFEVDLLNPRTLFGSRVKCDSGAPGMINRIQEFQRTKLVKVTDTRRKQIYSKVDEKTKNFFDELEEDSSQFGMDSDDSYGSSSEGDLMFLQSGHLEAHDQLMLSLETPPRSPYETSYGPSSPSSPSTTIKPQYFETPEESSEEEDLFSLMNRSDPSGALLQGDENNSKILDDIIEMMNEQDGVKCKGLNYTYPLPPRSDRPTPIKMEVIEDSLIPNLNSVESSKISINPTLSLSDEYGLSDFRFPQDEGLDLDGFDYLNNLSNCLEPLVNEPMKIKTEPEESTDGELELPRMKDCMLNSQSMMSGAGDWASTPPPTNPSSPMSSCVSAEDFISPEELDIEGGVQGNEGRVGGNDDFEMDEDLIKSSLELFEDLSQEIERDLIGDFGIGSEWNWDESLERAGELDIGAIKSEPIDEVEDETKRIESLRSTINLDHPYCLPPPEEEPDQEDEDEEEEECEKQDLKLFSSKAQEEKDEKNLNILLNYPSIQARIKHIGNGASSLAKRNSLTFVRGSSDNFQKRKILHIPLKDLVRVLEEKITPSERARILSGQTVTINNCKQLLLQTLKRGGPLASSTLDAVKKTFVTSARNYRSGSGGGGNGVNIQIKSRSSNNGHHSSSSHSSQGSTSCSSSGSSSPSSRKGLASHNNTERIRRIDLRNSFDHLRDSIPHLETRQRVSKVEILRKANEYIQNLKSTELGFVKEQSDLKNTNKGLKDRVRALQRDIERKFRK